MSRTLLTDRRRPSSSTNRIKVGLGGELENPATVEGALQFEFARGSKAAT
jgi:hypothetical protein